MELYSTPPLCLHDADKDKLSFTYSLMLNLQNHEVIYACVHKICSCFYSYCLTAHCDTSQHIQHIYMFHTWAMNDKGDGNSMKLSKGGNGFITTRMPHVTINGDKLTVHSTCWQVVPMFVVLMNDNNACCFTAETMCSTVHSVCPCLVLISSTDFGLFNAKPMYIHKSNKNLQHSFLQIVSVVSSFLNTVPHLTHTVQADAFLCLQLHTAGSQFFHLTHLHTLWIQTFCMKLVYTELNHVSTTPSAALPTAHPLLAEAISMLPYLASTAGVRVCLYELLSSRP